MRKIYLVPNLVTTANLFCGFYSIVSSIQGDFTRAAWAIMAAGVFDMLDGRIARLARATSQFGVEYDSLSDLVSFGVAPGILLHQWALAPYERLGLLASFLFVVCGALRLARFNVNSSTLPSDYFQGLPIPMGAAMVSTYVIFNHVANWPYFKDAFVIFLTFALALLMVSSVRFPSYKKLNWRSKATFGYLMIGLCTMIFIAMKPEITLFLAFSTYLLISLFLNLFRILLPRAQNRVTQGSSPTPSNDPQP